MSLTPETIQKIIDLSPMEEKTIHGVKYFTKALSCESPHKPQYMQVTTLSGVVDYVNEISESDDAKNLFVHIVSPTKVRLISPLSGDFRGREHYLSAEPTNTQPSFGQHVSSEKFIISLLSNFVQDENTAKLMQAVGNMKTDQGVGVQDDGVSQTIVAKKSIGFKDERVNLPNPIVLAPFRSFPEIEQVPSEFVFRIKGSVEDGFYCGLHEADGEAWKIEAIKRVGIWLKTAEGMEGISIIA